MPEFVMENPSIRHARELLEVHPSSSLEDLKKAFRRMALLYHPDRNQEPQAPKIFDSIKKAYDLLKDPVQVRLLNKNAIKDRLSRTVIEGLAVTFGSFFGFRLFRLPGLTEKRFRLGKEKLGEVDQYNMSYAESLEATSILDHPAYDSLELVYAGRFSKEDEAELLKNFKTQKILELPWVTLNHRGIFLFLKQDLRQAAKCYELLNERIPLNIIFMYRLGLLNILLSFQEAKTSVLGAKKPEPRAFKKGVALLEACLKIAAQRPVGKQKCILIRKTLAEVYEKSGHKFRSQRMWREIEKLDPKSIEVAYRRKGLKGALRLLDSKKLAKKPIISV